MSHGIFKRLRSLALLVALSAGFFGQIVVAVAMPMQMSNDASAASSSTADSGSCPACPKQHGAPAMSASCALIFCAASPAVLPWVPAVAPLGRAAFPQIAAPGETGLTIRPDLGPPRSIHHN